MKMYKPRTYIWWAEVYGIRKFVGSVGEKGNLHTKKTLETNFYSPSKEENEGDVWFFIPFKLLYILFFLWLFFTKGTVSRVWFHCEHLLLKSRDSTDHFLELKSTFASLNSRRLKAIPWAFSACKVHKWCKCRSGWPSVAMQAFAHN